MRIVVFGADGGVGRRAVSAVTSTGHGAIAVTRSSRVLPEQPGNVRRVQLDVRDTVGVRRLFGDGTSGGQADALLWCIGVTRRSGPDVGRSTLPNVLAAAREAGVPRVVTVSGAAVTLPEDRKGFSAQVVSGLLRRVARDLVLDKEAEHLALGDGGMSWTEVRAPRLVDAEGTGRWSLVEEAPGMFAAAVAKGDVAAAMVQLAASRDFAQRAPFIVTTRRPALAGVTA